MPDINTYRREPSENDVRPTSTGNTFLEDLSSAITSLRRSVRDSEYELSDDLEQERSTYQNQPHGPRAEYLPEMSFFPQMPIGSSLPRPSPSPQDGTLLHPSMFSHINPLSFLTGGSILSQFARSSNFQAESTESLASRLTTEPWKDRIGYVPLELAVSWREGSTAMRNPAVVPVIYSADVVVPRWNDHVEFRYESSRDGATFSKRLTELLTAREACDSTDAHGRSPEVSCRFDQFRARVPLTIVASHRF